MDLPKLDKSLDVLYSMSHPELVRYFGGMGTQDLLGLLRHLKIKPPRVGRLKLIEFIAKEFAVTGMYMRIAGKHCK